MGGGGNAEQQIYKRFLSELRAVLVWGGVLDVGIVLERGNRRDGEIIVKVTARIALVDRLVVGVSAAAPCYAQKMSNSQ